MKITDNNSNSSNDKSKTPKKPGREPQEGAPSINGFKMAKRNGKLFKSLRKKTKKIIDAQFTMVMIFENVSSDPAFYQKGTLTPLYITCSPYEAAEACIRLFYIKCYPYYKLWCEKYQVPMGVEEPSWWDYLASLVPEDDGENERVTISDIISNEFFILSLNYHLSDMMPLMRSVFGPTLILGMPSEDRAEFETFREVFGQEREGTSLSPEGTAAFSAKKTLGAVGCESVAAFLGRVGKMYRGWEEKMRSEGEGHDNSLF